MNAIAKLLTPIPLVDLRAQRAAISEDIEAAIARVLDRCDFILGEDLRLFEREFADYCEVPYALGGRQRNQCPLPRLPRPGSRQGRRSDRAGDDSFAFTAFGVSLTGAQPVRVDVRTLIDPGRVEAAITPRTKAIIPVHLYGQCADMTAVCSIAAKYSLTVIEDAAQAHGAIYAGRRAGSLGDIVAPLPILRVFADGVTKT